MANSSLTSVNNRINAATTYGNWPVWWHDQQTAVVTAATTTSGKVTGRRMTRFITMPTLGAGVPACFLTYGRVNPGIQSTVLVGLEYLLGTLTVSSNAYVDGVSSPTKNILGTSVTTAFPYVVAVVTTAMTATTPVLTINYTNESGTTGRSATLTLPTNALINSAYLITPHLQAGDLAIRDLSASGPNGLSINTGSAGVIKVYGILPLGITATGSAMPFSPDPLTISQIKYPIESADIINFYVFGSTTALNINAALSFTPDF